MAGVELIPLKIYQSSVLHDEEVHKTPQNIQRRSDRETESETNHTICHQETVTLDWT